MQLEISFGLWKRLTSLLEDENDTYDSLIERLIAGASEEADPGTEPAATVITPPPNGSTGAYFKDVFLPSGTELRATHKGKTYFAKISGSEWIDGGTGERRSSPSQAAYFITGNNVNGWLFWLVKRPGDQAWHSLNALRAR